MENGGNTIEVSVDMQPKQQTNYPFADELCSNQIWADYQISQSWIVWQHKCFCSLEIIGFSVKQHESSKWWGHAKLRTSCIQTAYCARMLSFCLWNQFKLPFSSLLYVYWPRVNRIKQKTDYILIPISAKCYSNTFIGLNWLDTKSI